MPAGQMPPGQPQQQPDQPPPPMSVGQPPRPIAPDQAAQPFPPDLVVNMQEVSRRFGDVVAVDQVTFGVPQSAIVGVIGPSGAGKTTIIRLMTGS